MVQDDPAGLRRDAPRPLTEPLQAARELFAVALGHGLSNVGETLGDLVCQCGIIRAAIGANSYDRARGFRVWSP